MISSIERHMLQLMVAQHDWQTPFVLVRTFFLLLKSHPMNDTFWDHLNHDVVFLFVGKFLGKFHCYRTHTQRNHFWILNITKKSDCVVIVFHLIWNQTSFRLVPNQSENGVNTIWFWFDSTMIQNLLLKTWPIRMARIVLPDGQNCVAGWPELCCRMAEIVLQDGQNCVAGWSDCVPGWLDCTPGWPKLCCRMTRIVLHDGRMFQDGRNIIRKGIHMRFRSSSTLPRLHSQTNPTLILDGINRNQIVFTISRLVLNTNGFPFGSKSLGK